MDDVPAKPVIVARDGEALRDFWDIWRGDEDEHHARDSARSRADLVIDGDPALKHDEGAEFVAN